MNKKRLPSRATKQALSDFTSKLSAKWRLRIQPNTPTDDDAAISTEDILRELKNEMTIVLVTNLVQQARRLADRTAFFSASRLIEADETEIIFNRPKNRLTERYVTGDFG